MADKALIDQLKASIRAVEAGSASTARESETGSRRGNAGRKVGTRSDEGASSDPKSAEDAFKKIVALVNVSDRSERGIRERLGRTGFSSEAIDEAVSRALSYGFLDDDRFAATLIRSRLSQGKGLQGIERELRSHGIEIDAVPGWPEEFDMDEGAEFDRAMSFLERRPPRSKNLREGAYRKLLGKGFSSGTAASAARVWSEKQSGENA